MSVAGGVDLDSFHIPGVASGHSRHGIGSRGDDGCTQDLGFTVDTEFSCALRDSDSPLDWVTQKPSETPWGSPRPRSAGVCISLIYKDFYNKLTKKLRKNQTQENLKHRMWFTNRLTNRLPIQLIAAKTLS